VEDGVFITLLGRATAWITQTDGIRTRDLDVVSVNRPSPALEGML